LAEAAVLLRCTLPEPAPAEGLSVCESLNLSMTSFAIDWKTCMPTHTQQHQNPSPHLITPFLLNKITFAQNMFWDHSAQKQKNPAGCAVPQQLMGHTCAISADARGM
jgi:hypothetical protein